MNLSLSIYLFKPAIQSFNDTLIADKEREKIGEGSGNIQEGIYSYEIYMMESPSKEPEWAKLVRDQVTPDRSDFARGSVKSLLILLKVPTAEGARIFAYTFGYARFHIDPAKVEPKFGLITTLNTMNSEKIKTVSSRILGTKTIQRMEAANLDSTMNDFTFEFDSELLRLIEGVCTDKSLGGRISGSDVLHIRSNVNFNTLPMRCIDLFNNFRMDNYKNNFEFIDFFEIERDPNIIGVLEQALVDAIQSRQYNNQISVAFPDQFQNSQSTFYKIRFQGKKRISGFPDVSLRKIYDFFEEESPTLEQLETKIKVKGYNANDDECTQWVPLYDFFIFEHEHEGQTYILTHRNWYRIDRDYLSDLDSKLRVYVKGYTGPSLDQWQKDWEERDYNYSYNANSEFLILDRDNFIKEGTSGRGRIEIADLFHLPSKSLIAVKPLNRSSTLSHLFAQGSVSATLFSELEEYRLHFLKEVNSKWSGEFEQEDYRKIVFVFAIATGRRGDILELLPFFSKVNLLRHSKRISRLGYRVEIVKIQKV